MRIVGKESTVQLLNFLIDYVTESHIGGDCYGMRKELYLLFEDADLLT